MAYYLRKLVAEGYEEHLAEEIIDAANNYASYLLNWYSTLASQINSYGQTTSVIQLLTSASLKS